MADSSTVYPGKRYRLRAGNSISVGNQGSGQFILHTFGSEVNDVDSYSYKTSLPASTDFRGQFGEHVSASFNRQSDVSGDVFSGEIVHKTQFHSEDFVVEYSDLLPGSFIECTSLSISYNTLGQATISYTIISESTAFQVVNPIRVGGRIFTGYVSNINLRKIPKTKNYEIQVSLVTTTN